MLISIIVQIFDPIKIFIAFLVFGNNPGWIYVALSVILASAITLGITELLSPVPTLDIVLLPNLIGSTILLLLAKFLGEWRQASRAKKSEDNV
jgi:uncharacterized membrane protein YedE/YeeE